MKVAYLTDTPEIGGAERNLADMALAARAAGSEVTLLAPQDTVVEYLRERVPGAELRQLGSDRYHYAGGAVKRGLALVRQVGVLSRALHALGPDVLHVNNGGFPGSDLCRIAPLAGRLARVPVTVMSVHTVPWERSHLSNPALQAAADRVVWANLDGVICPSGAVMDGLRESRGMPSRLGRLLHYGVREPVVAPGTAEALRRRLAPGEEPVVGMVSNRAVAEKGYDVFIEALARIPEIHAVVVGPHPGAGFLERVEQLGLTQRLSLEGPQREVGSYYAAMDVLVVPSTAYECMPLVILEAMALGRPVIGSRLSGIPEAIADRQTGRTFPRGDVEALGSIIREFLTGRSEWRRMGEAGRRRWECHFTWEKMCSELAQLYRGLHAQSGHPIASPDDGRSSRDTSSSTDAEGAPRVPSS